jgi:hypothetical protein
MNLEEEGRNLRQSTVLELVLKRDEGSRNSQVFLKQVLVTWSPLMRHFLSVGASAVKAADAESSDAGAR